MIICASCGTEIEGGRKKLCRSCLQDMLHATWKRQIRIYAISIVCGVMLLLYDISEVRALPHGAASIPPYLLGSAAVGGLAVLGGLFGLGLAAFFKMWHQKKTE